MIDPSDESLLQRSVQGDEHAFVQFLSRYRQRLARYIRSRLANSADADDVLQETLIAAWVGLPQLREAASVQAWLMQVARNRCRDYFRAKGRREVPMEERDLAERVDRFGLRGYHQACLVAEVVEALEEVPAAQREAARRFYLDGLSIAEIAANTQSPAGTVKRQLFQARKGLRQALGVTLLERSMNMEKQTATERGLTFPSGCPDIRISKSQEPPFSVDCPELRWWAIIPQVDEQAAFAYYNAPDGSLSEVVEMQAVHPAKVHEVTGVEIQVRPWKHESGWQTPWLMYGRLTDQKAQYLATLQPYEGTTLLRTFLDADFDWDWGEMDRVLEDRGDYVSEADGSLKRIQPSSEASSSGAGMFCVGIGAKQWTCLRVLEVSDDVRAKSAQLTESYLTQAGRTLLVRHFCHPDFSDVAKFPVVVNAAERRMVDGGVFLHWYDMLTSLAL